MTEKQYQDIKEYVLSRLEKEDHFWIDAFQFSEMFGLAPGYYQELIERVTKEDHPFLNDARCKDGYGDPSGQFQFYRRLEEGGYPHHLQ